MDTDPCTLRLEEKLKKFPLGRIVFITIRCPQQVGPWTKIGKVNDWIRRYSSCYFIVKGVESGTHFHLIAGLKPDHSAIKPVKGIHFHIKDLKKDNPCTVTDPIILDDIRESKYHAQFREQSTILRLKIPHECLAISTMIKKHFALGASRLKRSADRDRKSNAIRSIVLYLLKNLNEPRPDEISVFSDYILKD